ncbi:ABC-type cobalt transport system, ATPase component [Gottschalkia purinilytica]|uniref:ABC-type cobalt transport system, ATPase component n=1 Tax=Gottschalkia purinilytica TaxID=1503 RepID=A0A0L0WE78_GOTPU|nr:ABC transporter ATP-binding protein [Gottschalkia purinilytica]KNF09741.1 ABC-type cobalt transport system, ATPase component [Gottschalkia purinilytica]
MDIIEIKDLTYRYPIADKDALKDVNLKVKKGEFCAIIGRNGGGKTTLCNVIRGFVPHFHKGDLKGEVFIDGKNISEYSIGELAMKVGFVFQNPFTQVSGVKETVFDEIAYGLENLGVHPDEIRTRVEKVIELINIGHLRDKNPTELSGGQRQRVALASIIVMEPDILVIDEPTSQLDPQGTEEVFEIIKLMKNEGKTIILVEHKIELIAEYADHVILMDEGKIVLDGSTKEILSNEEVMELGTTLPQYALLGLEMRKRGIEIKDIPITESQTEAQLKKLLGIKEDKRS